MHWDGAINITSVVGFVAILVTIVNYGQQVVGYLRSMSFRVNVLWDQFSKDHPEVAKAAEFEWKKP